MNDLHRIIQFARERAGERLALATIIDIIGSSYRRIGAKMAFATDGTSCGMVSAGCLEDDLRHHAQTVLQTTATRSVTYDLLNDDPVSWGPTSGCNGKITIYIEPIESSMLLKWGEELHAGQTLLAIKYIDGPHAGSSIYIQEKPYIDDSLSSVASLTQELRNLVAQFAQSNNRTQLLQTTISSQQIVIERYRPRERLYLFGAGADAEPVVALATQMDFAVTIVDPRENRCNSIYFPLAEHHIIRHPHSFLQQHTPPVDSYIVVMTHNFEWDRMLIEHLIHQPYRYVGILGSKQRFERLLDLQTKPPWLHSPIGIAINAEGPQEIAVSIVAQLIHTRAKARLPAPVQATNFPMQDPNNDGANPSSQSDTPDYAGQSYFA